MRWASSVNSLMVVQGLQYRPARVCWILPNHSERFLAGAKHGHVNANEQASLRPGSRDKR
jgi:hypothetical protein